MPEEAVAIDSESENEQLRSCSPALPEQVAKTEDAIEQYITEPELPKTTVLSTSAKKKKKAKVAPKLQIPVDSLCEHPAEWIWRHCREDFYSLSSKNYSGENIAK